jgi:hypothetical protein
LEAENANLRARIEEVIVHTLEGFS